MKLEEFVKEALEAILHGVRDAQSGYIQMARRQAREGEEAVAGFLQAVGDGAMA
jgi:hypothetical protein